MVAEDFITAKRTTWERLTQLTRSAQSNIIGLEASELQELGRLYRQATSDLAQARRDYPGHPVAIYLNDLVAQGHSAIYRERSTAVSKLKDYFLILLPRTFRETLPFTLAAFLVFLIPALVGWIIAARDPNQGLALMPELTPAVENIRSGHEWWRDINDQNGGNAAFILTNNISVSFRAFIGGLSVGIFTIYLLYFNGLMLGVLSGAAQNLGFADNLWSFIIAHGVVELSIIFLAGGAGFQLAWAILRPGLLSRRTALLAAARRAFILSGAIIMFLILAGLIEGFISPTYLPLWVKIAVALISGGGMYGYLFLAGRHVTSTPNSDDSSIIRIEAV
jgi:uncharacterized membrane protein SpoIIM required for sporulation